MYVYTIHVHVHTAVVTAAAAAVWQVRQVSTLHEADRRQAGAHVLLELRRDVLDAAAGNHQALQGAQVSARRLRARVVDGRWQGQGTSLLGLVSAGRCR